MTENILAFVNVFILPLISLYVCGKISNKELFFTFENICRYAIFLSVGIVCNRGIAIIIKQFIEKEININSNYYTVIGIFMFVLLAIISEIVVKHFSVRIEAKNEKK